MLRHRQVEDGVILRAPASGQAGCTGISGAAATSGTTAGGAPSSLARRRQQHLLRTLKRPTARASSLACTGSASGAGDAAPEPAHGMAQCGRWLGDLGLASTLSASSIPTWLPQCVGLHQCATVLLGAAPRRRLLRHTGTLEEHLTWKRQQESNEDGKDLPPMGWR